jgi:hypothetical protein
MERHIIPAIHGLPDLLHLLGFLIKKEQRAAPGISILKELLRPI